jgi:Tc5 transposase DNA-binding domain
MVRRINKKANETELQLKIGMAGLADGMYISVDDVVKALGVKCTSLYCRIRGVMSRSDATAACQVLTKQEERELAKWISTSTATGNPVHRSFVREVAEKLCQRCVDSEPNYTPSIGPTWVPQFLRRHPRLKTKLSHAIEIARVNDVTEEQVCHFNQEFRRVIDTQHRFGEYLECS